MKKFVPALVVLSLIFGFSFMLRPDVTEQLILPQASAQELVQDSITTLQSLSDEELQLIKDRLKTDDVFALLQAAHDAPNLTYAAQTEISCSDVEIYQNEPIDDENAFDLMMSDDVDLSDPNCRALLFTQPLVQDSSTNPLGRDFRLVNVFDSSEESYEDLTYVQFVSSDNVFEVLGLDDNFIPLQAFGFGSGALPDGASFGFTFYSTSTDPSSDLEEGQETFFFEGQGSATIPDSGTFDYDTSTGCTNWQSEDGMMGGGGC